MEDRIPARPIDEQAPEPTHDTLIQDALNQVGLEQYMQTVQPPAAVLLVNLTNLEAIIKHLGAAEGNNIIIDTYRILRDSTRPNDVIARIKESEFVVVLDDKGNGTKIEESTQQPRQATPSDHIEEVRERIAELRDKYLDINPLLKHSYINSDLAVGGVVWSGASDLEELINLAEADMQSRITSDQKKQPHIPKNL